jgi:hypothetical protein
MEKTVGNANQHVSNSQNYQIANNISASQNMQDVDLLKMRPTDTRKVHELQDANDRLQRQVVHLDKEVKYSNDPLSLVAERERCFIMMARNQGEILKYHRANEQRLVRISELQAANQKLKEAIAAQRMQFLDSYDMNPRTQRATEFFLIKSQIEANEKEIAELIEE